MQPVINHSLLFNTLKQVEITDKFNLKLLNYIKTAQNYVSKK
jgi:hypothetical protein